MTSRELTAVVRDRSSTEQMAQDYLSHLQELGREKPGFFHLSVLALISLPPCPPKRPPSIQGACRFTEQRPEVHQH